MTDEIVYSGASLNRIMFCAFFGGIVNALGLGGGVIFNPMLLHLGICPQAVTATGMYMILFSSTSTTVAQIFFGGLPIQLALWISMWSVVAIFISLKIIKKVIDRFNKPSIVVIVLASVLGLSAIMVPVYDI